MKQRLLAFLLVLGLALGLTSSALAQEYSFSVPRERVRVMVNGDGTLAVDYVFEFQNAPGAHVIDFVDVGLPNSQYDFQSISADVNGKLVSISHDYQGDGTGVAVDLGSYAIAPGQSGSVHVRVGKIERMIYPDDKDEQYASVEFMPTYFGSAYVHGATDLTFTLVLPPGLASEQPRYHPARGGWPGENAPQAALDSQGNITYTWQSSQASAAASYTFGASFPASAVPAEAIVRTSWLELLFGGILALLGGLLNLLPFLCIGGAFFGLPILSAISESRRKLQYMSPKIAIEGHGIKRGLTAVEAAVLLGLPLDKVMTMILFSLVKKGAAQVSSRNPLQIVPLQPAPENLREYEKSFLDAFNFSDHERRKALQDMTVALINAVESKMSGFSSKETKDYYRAINQKAWQQIEAARTPEVKSQMYDEALEWTMLGTDSEERTRRVFTGPVILPHWWGRYDPGYGHSAPVSGPAPVGGASSSGGKVSLPGADFAASVITTTQTFAQKVLGGTNTFTEGITKKTNPIPVVRSSSGGRGGGGGCACACACAGCACACAGGGR